MYIDYDDESKVYSPDEINDFLLEAVKHGESYHVRKTLQYFGHIWIDSDQCHAVDSNPVIESFINIDKACFDEFVSHFQDIPEWRFNTGPQGLYKELSFFEIAVENGLTEDIMNLCQKGEVINTRSLTILFTNNSAEYVEDLLKWYKTEVNKEIKPNAALFSNILREQIRNLLLNKNNTYENKKTLVDKWKIEFNKVFSGDFMREDFLSNPFLNYKLFDEAEDSVKKQTRESYDRSIKDITGMSYIELIKISAPRIFESPYCLNTMSRLLNREEMKDVLENYFYTLAEKSNSNLRRVSESLIELRDNKFVGILKKHDLVDFVYGEGAFLPERYKLKSEIETDIGKNTFYPVIESLILKKKMKELPSYETQVDHKMRKRI